MKPQKKYYTVFMVSYSWSRNLNFLCDFIDWILSYTNLYEKAEILYVLKNGAYGTPKTLNKSTFSEFKTMLLNAEIYSVCVSKAGRGGIPVEFHLYLSCFCHENIPDYISYLNPSINFHKDNPNGLRVLSFSFDKKLFLKYFKIEHMYLELCEQLEKLFINMNCIYGYMNESENIIASPFSYIKDNNVNSGQRIIDFKYDSCIEDVYEFNLLSKGHIDKIEQDHDLMGFINSLKTKILYNDENEVYGISVYSSLQVESKYNFHSSLSSIFSENIDPGVKKSYLLINQMHLKQFDKIENLQQIFSSDAIELFPYDFVQIDMGELAIVEEYYNVIKKLQFLYEMILTKNKQEKKYIHEYLEDYRGLYNKCAMYLRLPSYSMENVEFVKIRRTDDVNCKNLEITLLVKQGLSDNKIQKIYTLQEEWLELVEHHPDSYGTIGIIEDMKNIKLLDQDSIRYVIHGTALRQAAINLLILMIDEMNVEEFLVAYLIFGKIQISRWL